MCFAIVSTIITTSAVAATPPPGGGDRACPAGSPEATPSFRRYISFDAFVRFTGGGSSSKKIAGKTWVCLQCGVLLWFALVFLTPLPYLRIMGYNFSSRLTATLNLCQIYFKITWALAILLEHMHKKFEINRTMIKGGCQSGRKVVTHNSKNDLPRGCLSKFGNGQKSNYY